MQIPPMDSWRPSSKFSLTKSNVTMTPNPQENAPEAWIDIVRQKVASMRFGSVQIVVHEGRVTQVESTEKTRLPSEATSASRK